MHLLLNRSANTLMLSFLFITTICETLKKLQECSVNPLATSQQRIYQLTEGRMRKKRIALVFLMRNLGTQK